MDETVHLGVLLIYTVVALLFAAAAHVTKRVLAHQARYRRVSSLSRSVEAAEVATFVGVWYGLSVTITVFNKWVINYWRGGFPFPMTITAGHLILKAALARFLSSHPKSPFHTEDELSPSIYVKLVVPMAAATSLDVVFSNMSFRYVTVTFYTILKSGALLWILIWALLLRLERCSTALIGTCALMSVGLGLASYGETDFSMIGAILILSASCLAGLRWGLSQRLMIVHPMSRNPLLLLSQMAPTAAVCAIVVSVIFEGHGLVKEWQSESSMSFKLEVIGVLAAGGFFAFFLLLAEVQLVNLTSSLSLGVFGTIKELVQIVLAVMVFGDRVTYLNMAGLFLAILGTAMYKQVKSPGSKSENSREDIRYDPVNQVDKELEGFEDGFLADGWDE